jgi:hypothetical protein
MSTAPVPAHPTDGDGSSSSEQFIPVPLAAPPPPSFWHRPQIVNLVSFGSSLMLHLTVVLIGVFFVKTVQEITRPAVEQQVIIPDAAIV